MGQMLPVAAFRTDALAPHTRYDAWRNLISAVFEPLLPDGRGRADITAEASSVNLGQVLLVHAKAEAQHFRRTRRLIAKEGLDHYLIQVYRRGVCEGTYGDIQNIVHPGDVKIIDLAQPFATFNTDFDNTTLTIPRAALAPLLDRPDSLHGTVLPASSPLGSVLGSHIHALSAAAPDMTPEQGAVLAAGSIRLVAACLGASPRAQAETATYRTAAIGQAVRDFIESNLTSAALGPDLLVQRFGLSRAGLYRLFMDDGGIAAYIQNRRLRQCFLAITDPTQSARRNGDIAYGFGFTSDAVFSRAFRRAFGMTPSEARMVAGRVQAPGPGTFINEWMRGLRSHAGWGDAAR